MWLIGHEDSAKDTSKEFRNEIKAHLKRVRPRMEVREELTDIWNLERLVRTFSYIVQLERAKNNMVWVNISTGSKLEGAAGTLVAMAWGASSYYVLATSQQTPDKKERWPCKSGPKPIAWGFGGKIDLPNYQLDCPEAEALNVMAKLNSMGTAENPWVRKKQLLAETGASDTSNHMRLNRLLEKLEKPPAKVAQEGATRRRRVALTEEGRLTLLLFGKSVTAPRTR